MSQKSNFWNQRLRGLKSYTPGFQPEIRPGTIKLNTNENPWPPSPLVLKAITEAAGNDLRLYPSADWRSLREEIARTYQVQTGEVFCGNGSDEILTLIFRCFTDPGDKIILPWPTYSLYPILAAAAGCETVYLDTEEDFSFDLKALAKSQGRVIFLANPNAPTGLLTAPEELLALAKTFPGLIVVDEAYIDFAPPKSSVLSGLKEVENLIVLRTFSKSFSLCGIRCGYAFAHPDLIRGLMVMKDSYNLDLLAQEAARAAIEDLSWMEENSRRVIASRERFSARLKDLGFEVLPSAANFVFSRHPRLEARAIFESLREKDIHVRFFDSPRISDWLRISIGTDHELEQVLVALGEILAAR